MRLEQRRVLITGGGSGIGLELARALVPTNEVVIAGQDMGRLERAKADLPALYVLRLDVTSEPDARSAIDWMADRLGGMIY